ncbi:hypothetical protein HGRIS_004018 [Hohenbuehelia grisea]|uniref:Uncharacterized protein n=1 Tax=Hohenbuehelia grisea TaxID=104357 RepID=A0ABR3JID1_9AGAR
MVDPNDDRGSQPVHSTPQQEMTSAPAASSNPSRGSRRLTVRIAGADGLPLPDELSSPRPSDINESPTTAMGSGVFSAASEATLCSPRDRRLPKCEEKVPGTPPHMLQSNATTPASEHKEFPPISRATPVSPDIVSFNDDPNYDQDLIYDPADEARVVKILDTRLMSCVLLTLFTLSMDRTNHSNAIADNLPDDLEIDVDIVNLGAVMHAGFFFFFSLVGAVIAKWAGPARWIPILAVSWGIITVGHVFIQGKHDYLFVRSGGAIIEAGIIPSLLVYLGRWYKTNEYATRLAWLWGTQMMASAVTGLFASTILKLRGVLGLSGWRWLFLTNGIITILVGVASWFYLPRDAANTAGGLRGRKPWFTPFQIKIAVTRIIRNDPCKRYMSLPVTWKDVYETFTDIGIWHHILNTTIGLTPLTPLHIYFPLTIRSFNLDVFAANALTAPPYLIQAASTILLLRHSDNVQERGFHGAFGAGWMLIGWIILLCLPRHTSLVVKYVCATIVASWPAVHPLNVAWMSENAGSVGKRTVATGAMSGFAAIHGTWGSQIYRVDDLPDFKRGNALNIVFASTATLMWLTQKLYYRRKNTLNTARLAALDPVQRSLEETQQVRKGNKSLLFTFRD